MSSTETDLFMVTVTFDTPKVLSASNEYKLINAILKRNPESCFCIHKYKVTGEQMLVLVFRVKEVKQLDKTLDSIRNIAKCTTECTALINEQPFPQEMCYGGAHRWGNGTDNCIAGCPRLIWILFTPNYDGISMADLKCNWSLLKSKLYDARAQGRKFEVYKAVAEFKSHLFIEQSLQDTDAIMSKPPTLTGTCKTVLDLDYFCE